jgi:hypothetical protein
LGDPVSTRKGRDSPFYIPRGNGGCERRATLTEENQPPREPPVPEEWLKLAEEWIGQEVSPCRDEGSEPRGGGPTQTFGRLEAVNEWGVVIDEEHSEVPEGVLAFYP